MSFCLGVVWLVLDLRGKSEVQASVHNDDSMTPRERPPTLT